MEEKESYVRFYELFTQYGVLYTYETYQNNPDEFGHNEIPVIREFFTGEEAQRGYTTLSFMNGKSKFVREIRGIDGRVLSDYYRELSPYKFLKKVAPYLKDEDTKAKKEKEIYDIFDRNINNFRSEIVITKDKITKEQKNNEAKRILKRYMK